MQRFLPLAAVLAIVLLWNAPAWNYQNHYHLMPDVPALQNSYQNVAHIPLGGTSAWFGPWWYEGAAAFRPLSSHFYWPCLYFIGSGLPSLSTALVALVSLSLCAVVYLLTLRLTKSVPTAMFAGVLAGVVRFDYPMLWTAVPHRAAWTWFPLLDNSLAALFLVIGALLLTHNKRRWAFVSFCAALFCKELAIMFPAIVLAFQWHRLRERRTQVLLGASVAAVVAFLAYRAAVLPPSYDERVFNNGGAYQSWWIYQAWLLLPEWDSPLTAMFYILDTAAVWLRELSLVVASLWLLRLMAVLPQLRALWPALTSFLAIYAPLLLMNTIAHRFVIAMPFFCVAVAVAVHGMLPLFIKMLMSVNPRRPVAAVPAESSRA